MNWEYVAVQMPATRLTGPVLVEGSSTTSVTETLRAEVSNLRERAVRGETQAAERANALELQAANFAQLSKTIEDLPRMIEAATASAPRRWWRR